MSSSEYAELFEALGNDRVALLEALAYREAAAVLRDTDVALLEALGFDEAAEVLRALGTPEAQPNEDERIKAAMRAAIKAAVPDAA